MWIPMDKVFDLGEPGACGNENDTYVSADIIYKVNNLLNAGSICKLLEKILLHNQLFPNTSYKLYGNDQRHQDQLQPQLPLYIKFIQSIYLIFTEYSSKFCTMPFYIIRMPFLYMMKL